MECSVFLSIVFNNAGALLTTAIIINICISLFTGYFLNVSTLRRFGYSVVIGVLITVLLVASIMTLKAWFCNYSFQAAYRDISGGVIGWDKIRLYSTMAVVSVLVGTFAGWISDRRRMTRGGKSV